MLVEPSAAAIEEAARRLRDGQPIVFPTETVYGLGVDTFQPVALDAVYAIKGRPLDNPLIAHVDGVDGPAGARRVVAAWDDRAAALAERFWPGPLTLVLEKADAVPERATGGRPTVAVRAPRHAVARSLLGVFGGPISAPSANRSGHVSPTTARHVADDYGADHDTLFVLDGGACEIGLESTVLDLTTPAATILRPGSVTAHELRETIGPVETPAIGGQAASPGTAPRHYAPRTPAEVVGTDALAAHLAALETPVAVLCFDADAVPRPHRPVVMPQGAGEYAQRLYGALRDADALGLARIVIEAPPGSNDFWQAINDRLARACGPCTR